MELLLIANPRSGTRQVRRYLPDLISFYSRQGYDCRVFLPQPGQDAEEYVAARCGQVDLVVCAGGDGTLNRVASGIIRSGADTPLGYIPAGSSNVFAECMGISPRIMAAAADTLTGVAKPVDMGRFNQHYFVCVASCGAFCSTSYATPQNAKNLLGRFAYFLEGLKDVHSIRRERLLVGGDGLRLEGDYIFGAITNVASVGGVFHLDPAQVDASDGLFEVVLVQAPTNPLELQSIVAALRSRDYRCGLIQFLRTDKLSIQAPPDMTWTLDGEYEPGTDQVNIENLQGALRMIVPERPPEGQEAWWDKKILDNLDYMG